MSRRENIPLYSMVTLHALGWLCLANLIGLLLALLLIMPSLNAVIAPFTYGRLIPLHLNGQLYGWCFLPLIGILFAWYFGNSRNTRWACRAVEVWSLALGVGCLYWLFGHTSGKLFMEWRGGARWLLSANMLFLSAVLVHQLLIEPDTSRNRAAMKWILWLVLLPVPILMYWAANPALFPPVNPDSGGATGGSLLVSSLGAITIMWLTPFLLQVPSHVKRSWIGLSAALQGLHYGAFMLLDHGDQSHYLPSQIIGLASLLIWVPLLIRHYRGFTWPPAARPWLWSFALWGAFLVISANIMFAPGLLDRWKFTHFLVGHTHAAMAGMLSSFNLLVLIAINHDHPGTAVLGHRGIAWAWNIGVILQVATLKIFGVFEGEHPAALFYGSAVTDWAFSLRLLSGVLMFLAGLCWFLGVLGQTAEQSEVQHG